MINSLTQFIGSSIVATGYYFVIFEEKYRLKKSIAMIVAATLLWVFIGSLHILSHQEMHDIFIHEFASFCEIFFFIVVAMSYVLSLEDLGFFDILQKGFSRIHLSTRMIFWITGLAAFFLSPLLDNLTTALLMGQILLAFAPNHPGLISVGMINLVIASNSGGVFSPFGDLTSLMIWQQGFVPTLAFRHLFLPSFISYLIPASILSFQFDNVLLEKRILENSSNREPIVIVGLFFCTIFFTLLCEHFWGLPAVFGMLMGLSFIVLYERSLPRPRMTSLFSRLHRIEWDTLLFFYGIMLSIEGLKVLGILELISKTLYTSLPSIIIPIFGGTYATIGHILVGLLSSLLDNIPMMAAVLKMNFSLPLGSWLLLTLTTGTGGSLLAIGSAAGIALMGLSQKHYTFQSHLKWTPLIFLGYAVGISSHLWLNQALFL
jgi:Na+/H+ antiporter NhaD/arsenite permease-like protein